MSASLPQQWLDKANEDLIVTRLVLREGYTAHACFLAQQCIEKALKAYLIAKTNDHPRIHRLVDLLSLCIALDSSFSQFLADCAIVDQYYIPTRYPSGNAASAPSGIPSHAEAEEVTTAAEHILQFVTQQLT